MYSEDLLTRATSLIRQAAPDVRQIIAFGSQVHGTQSADSDLDVLVIEPDLSGRHEEMVRLRDALRPLKMPVDLLVVDETEAREWGTVRGTVLHEALTTGRVMFDATQLA